jgi:hypothetical protein
MANDDFVRLPSIRARDHSARPWLYVRFTLSHRDV